MTNFTRRGFLASTALGGAALAAAGEPDDPPRRYIVSSEDGSDRNSDISKEPRTLREIARRERAFRRDALAEGYGLDGFPDEAIYFERRLVAVLLSRPGGAVELKRLDLA